MKNRNTSKFQATFYPPTLMLPFTDVNLPTKLSTSSDISYFQNYRNETLSKFSMPPYEWGMQSIPYSPSPEIGASKARRKINSNLTMLSNDISTIDSARMKEVDDLFKSVQIYRNQYKDRTGSSHPLAFYKPDNYDYQCAPGMTTSYFSKYPQDYIEYKIPTVLPLTYGRRKQIPYIPDLSLVGIYNEASCSAYKR
ncbi:hypothetical protein WH47_05430 [Habropoda laboriosa]|uniref:Protein FAM166C n=2 Tax=Habropoda laboriosa TaxID=597456 RepID=A0A0L7QUZ0_9HYME|nr:hypothetical protein WH47_05430 [Habropoda laboriosa]